MITLLPGADTLAAVVAGVGDDQLCAPTPCADTSVADLLDHVDGLAFAFTAAASKTPLPPGNRAPSADGSRLAPDWRSGSPRRLTDLAAAWLEEAAWRGDTEAGEQRLPGAVAGVVALNQVVVHGWDLAVATGQRFDVDGAAVDAAYGFVREAVAANPQGTPGLFARAVPVAESAPLLDRLLGLTGRDPAWWTGGSHG